MLGPVGSSRGRRGLEVFWKTSGGGSRTCTPDQDNSCWETKEQTFISFNFAGKGRWQAPGRSSPLTCGTWKFPTRLSATLGLEEGPRTSRVDSLAKLAWAIHDGTWAEDPCKAPQCHPPALAGLRGLCQLSPSCCLENPWLCHGTKWNIISQLNGQIVKYTMIYQLFHCNNCSHIVSLPLSLFLWFILFGCPIDISKMRFLSPSLSFLLSPLFLWQFIGLREVFPIMIISSCFVDKRST